MIPELCSVIWYQNPKKTLLTQREQGEQRTASESRTSLFPLFPLRENNPFAGRAQSSATVARVWPLSAPRDAAMANTCTLRGPLPPLGTTWMW